MFHLSLHFIVPALIAALFFRPRWQFAYLVMMATMLVDLDHLLAMPVVAVSDFIRCISPGLSLFTLCFVFYQKPV